MSFIVNYLNWHYLSILPKLLLLWRNLILFPIFYFSVPLHISTLFAPWKRQRVRMKPGFHLDDFLSVASFNLIARILGAFVRTITIVYGLLLIPLLATIGAVFVFLWMATPGLTVPLYLIRRKTSDQLAEIILKKANRNLRQMAILLCESIEGNFIFTRLGLNHQKFMEMLNQNQDPGIFTLFEEFLTKKNHPTTKIVHLFEAISETYKPMNTFLSQYGLKSNDVYQVALWYEKLQGSKHIPTLLSLDRIKSLPGVGADWAYGYTVEFDKFAKDLTSFPATFPLLLGREKEIDQMQRILIKAEGNNVLLVGEPGTARHLLLATLAQRIATGDCLPNLSHKRILALDMHSLTSAKPSSLEVKGLAAQILTEAEAAGNVIVFIDEIDKYVTATGEERIDLTDVFAKFAESSVGLIGITTPSFFHRYIEVNTTFAKLFEKVEIVPPESETLLQELEMSIVPILEKKHKILITYPALKKTIEDADRFLTTTPFPGKAIELLDETAVYITSIKHKSIMQDADVDEFLAGKLKMPIGDLDKKEKEKLVHLEELLHSRIVNQEEAIRVIAAALRRARLNVSNTNKPAGSFLFLGPTGVGKTETAKSLAQVYYGSEDTMLRFDMSQYQRQEGLERLIGSVKLGTAGEMTSLLADRPFALLLLDEIEKADKDILNLFLTLFDEGYIADSSGRKISAKNTIIIATSNAGAEYIRENINTGKTGEELQKSLINHVQEEHIFSPEFLNRFDAVVVFSPLSEGNLREVAKLQLDDLNRRLAPKEISVAKTPDLVKKLAHAGFDPAFGARAMKRVISEKIEDEVAKRLLNGSAKKGEQIQIDL